MYNYYSISRQDLNIKYFEMNLYFFKNIGIAFYGYVNQFAVVSILREIPLANYTGYASITLRSSYPVIILYSIVCYAGYISFGENIPEFIVLRQPLPGSLDILMTIGQFGVMITLVLGLVIRVRCNRNIIQYFLKNAGWIDKKPGEKVSKKVKVTVSLVLTLFPSVCAMLIQSNISDYVSLFSSLVCPYYILIAPCNATFVNKLLIPQAF